MAGSDEHDNKPSGFIKVREPTNWASTSFWSWILFRGVGEILRNLQWIVVFYNHKLTVIWFDIQTLCKVLDVFLQHRTTFTEVLVPEIMLKYRYSLVLHYFRLFVLWFKAENSDVPLVLIKLLNTEIWVSTYLCPIIEDSTICCALNTCDEDGVIDVCYSDFKHTFPVT